MDRRTAIWRVVILLLSSVLPLLLLSWVLIAPADAHETMPVYTHWIVTPSVQGTPTVDPTMTALQKEQLTAQIKQLENQSFWAWTNISTFLTVLVGLGVGIFGFWRWREDQHIEREKRREDQRIERENRGEERFQKVVEGLGGENEGARVGAAILLRTFLNPNYEQFYLQVFDLAAAHLRLRKADPDIQMPPDPLIQALIVVFKEAFPLARDRKKTQIAQFDPRSLDATGVRLESAYLAHVDLKGAWLVRASLRRTILFDANLEGADLREANLEGADLREANLRGANLTAMSLEAANLKDTKMYGVVGLTKEQRDACVKNGANFSDRG